MVERTWLYLYENTKAKKIYIGIGKSMERVFERHNRQAEDLRDSSGTLIRQTVEPFSSRRDALMAEAIAIHVASLMGMKPIIDSEQQSELFIPEEDSATTTNIQGLKSTKFLEPAIYVKDGEVAHEDLSETIIVPISPKDIEGRPSAFGGNSGEFFADRARGYWNVAVQNRSKIRRLIAVLTGSRRIILGSWDVDPEREWTLIPNHEKRESPYRTRVEIPIINESQDNVKDLKGKTYLGRLGQGVSYSADIKYGSNIDELSVNSEVGLSLTRYGEGKNTDA